jgi:hypothetical protein
MVFYNFVKLRFSKIYKIERRRGALAEELGTGLQNLLHECESRTRLQGRWRNWYTLRT